MTSQTLRLPDGQTYSVTPVFAGVAFKCQDLSAQPNTNAFPVGWIVVLRTEEDGDDDDDDSYEGHDDEPHYGTGAERGHAEGAAAAAAVAATRECRPRTPRRKRRVKNFVQPSLESDVLFISSISNPSNAEYKPAASPSRHIAKMLWITLYWYFQQPQPRLALDTPSARATPDAAKPLGQWKINIRRDGMFRGRSMIPRLERMGLIATEDSSVGLTPDDGGESWARMFVSQHMFWQIPAHLFLFTLQPNRSSGGLLSPSFPGSPGSSRPSSPVGGPTDSSPHRRQNHSPTGLPSYPRLESMGLLPSPNMPPAPYSSTSHLPTYYPPPPLLYTFSNGVRHPVRPKPHRMGEIFYCRFVPSVGQYLSFRVASSSAQPVPYLGPPAAKSPSSETLPLTQLCDSALLQLWMSKPRVSHFWGEYTPGFLDKVLTSKHCFPAIGMWDGVPFGYFEIYWAKEDILGRHVGDETGDWDRGIHIIVGEEWARGRVPLWLSSLVHWCFTADNRTMHVCLEPRIDNARLLRHLDDLGFSRQKQVNFPHKRSWYVKLGRANWTAPAL